MGWNVAGDEAVVWGMLPQLTGLRFLAALGVLLMHFAPQMELRDGLFRSVITAGGVGVSLFFLLSGVVLTYQYANIFGQRQAAPHYLQRRLARLWPLTIIGVLLVSLVYLFAGLMPESRFPATGELVWSWLGDLLFLRPWIPTPWVGHHWNVPAWTLGIELFFYLCLPGFLRSFGAPLLAAGPRALLTAAAGLWLMQLGMAASVTWAQTAGLNAGWANWLAGAFPPARLPEFLIGVMVGLYLVGIRDGRWLPGPVTRTIQARDAALAAAVLLLLGVIVVRPALPSPFQEHVLFVPGFAALLLALGSGRSRLLGWLDWPVFRLLGEASFALYITHWAVLQFCYLNGLLVSSIGPWVGMAASIALAVGLHVTVDRPLQLTVRRWLARPRAGDVPTTA